MPSHTGYGARDRGCGLRDRQLRAFPIQPRADHARHSARPRDSSAVTAPTDGRLEATIRELEATGGAIELLDSEWRLVWVSDELKAVLGEDDEQALGYGEHILSRYQAPPWRDLVDDESVGEVFSRNVPYVIHGTPGGLDSIRAFAAEELTTVLEDIEPKSAPPIWAFDMEIVQGGERAGRAWCYSTRLYDDDGDCFGIVRIYTV